MVAALCIYCQAPADSLEHPLPAAFGEFKDAPLLEGQICGKCNNHLGLLDEQFTRCGPEAFFRRLYGIQGRSAHDSVNPFYRGSAGGHRLEMKAHDPNLGIDVLVECENGSYRQLRQLVFVEQSGATKHLPIREGTSPEQLREAFQNLGVTKPFDVHLLFDPATEPWVEDLIKKAWPTATAGEGTKGSTVYQGAVGNVGLTNRYFRAVAKVGFHYFLKQFPEYTGHEQMFSEIRRYILDESAGVDQANTFIGKREHALLGAMLDPRIRPNGWRAHVLCAETVPGECFAYIQTFVSEDWPAPIYAVHLARDAGIIGSRAIGHAYMYYGNGPEGNFAGDALTLETTRANWAPPPLAPAIKSA
jgi:hypothetical protein